MITRAQFTAAALELRLTVARLDSAVAAVRDSGDWSGKDADRFFSNYDIQVRERLLKASYQLDALTVTSWP